MLPFGGHDSKEPLQGGRRKWRAVCQEGLDDSASAIDDEYMTLTFSEHYAEIIYTHSDLNEHSMTTFYHQ